MSVVLPFVCYNSDKKLHVSPDMLFHGLFIASMPVRIFILETLTCTLLYMERLGIAVLGYLLYLRTPLPFYWQPPSPKRGKVWAVMGKHPDLMVAHPTSTIFPTIGRNFEIS